MKNNKTGIISYGSYIPKYRITSQEIANTWNQDVSKITKGLLITEKSVPGKDEDAATMAVESTQHALQKISINPSKIGAIYVGSESHPYAVKPTASIVGNALGVGHDYLAADLQFACKSGTAAMQICYSAVQSNQVEYALAIGSDTAQAKPRDILEYSANAGAASILIGKHNPIATIESTLSFTSNTPDFWRRNTQKYPEHVGRFSVEPSYIKHITHATKMILDKTQLESKDIDHVIFHQPNGKLPLLAAKRLGFGFEQITNGLIVTKIGNSYSATTMLGLCKVLDIAKPNQKILVVSYGSGAGSDAFVLTTTNHITKIQEINKKISPQENNKVYLNYSEYNIHMEHL